MKSVLPVGLALSRRRLLQGAGSLAAAALAVPIAPRLAFGAATNFLDYPFQLGVASGDPWPDGFVIWTRLAPKPLEPGQGMSGETFAVDWEVAEDRQFQKVVAKGTGMAWAELGHSVHVEVTGLQPARPYWYRFRCGGFRSVTGRGVTAPAAGAPVDRLRFGVVGCQHYEQGLYTAYDYLAREELDFVYHYGDYIYEGLSQPYQYSRHLDDVVPATRQVGTPDTISLDDYRRRYARYKMDTDLQRAHAATSWVTVWDDHEVVNNWASDVVKGDSPPEIFRLRRQAAAQAYYEHMPLRRSSLPDGSHIRLYRHLAFGDLVDMHVLDTRQYRSPQPCNDGFRAGCAEADEPGRTMMGEQEEKWLFDALAGSRARFNLIAQQVMLMPCDRQPGAEDVRNMDSWEGYRQARRRLLQHLNTSNIHNVVVLTGDEHQNIVGNVPLDDRNPTGAIVASEFVVTSISSGGDGVVERETAKGMLADNPHIKLINDQRGYGLGEVTPKHLTMEMKVLDQVTAPGGKLSTRAKFAVDPAKPGIQKA